MSTRRAAHRAGFFGIGMVALVLFVAVGGAAAQGMDVFRAATQPQRRSIHVQGRAGMSVEPDVAYLSVGVETQGDTAAEAQGQLAERAANVLASLSRAGVDRSKLKTSSYQVSPVYSSQQDKHNVIIGYKAETTISVEIADLPSVAALVDAAMSAGANAVRSLSYDRKDKQAFEAKLIQAACTDAKMKADAAATALGVRLGAPVSVDIEDPFSYSGARVLMMKTASQDFLSSGELGVVALVSIEFDLLTE